MSTCSPQTIVIDFLEFLYTNYHHSTWMEWAKATWQEKTTYPAEDDPFEPIAVAYRTGQSDVLRGRYASWIDQLKDVLRSEKRRLATGYASICADATLLTY